MAELAWFPFYVDRFLSSRKTRTMTPEQVGIYLLLLCEQWDHGTVPDDPAEIEDISRAGHSQAMAVLQRCFSLTEHGWVNGPMEDIRAEQEVRSERLAEAGRRGAAKRYGTKPKKPGHSQATDSQAMARPKPPYSIREEERREEEKKEEAASTRTHAEFSTWMGEHAMALGALDYYAQAAVWGLWGPSGVQAHDWKGMGEERQKPILAAAIMTYASEGKRGFHRPFFAKILATAIRDAIASDHEGEARNSEEREAAELRSAAKAREAAEIARLNAAAAQVAGTVSIPAGSKRGGEPGRVHVNIGSGS